MARTNFPNGQVIGMLQARASKTTKGGRGEYCENDFNYRLRKQTFIKEYLKDCNATQAAIRAGYAKSHATVTGPQLVVKYREEINKLVERKLNKIDITVENVIQEMAKIAMVNVKDMFSEDGRLLQVHELPRHVAAAISSFEVEVRTEGSGDERKHYTVNKIKLWDKRSSIETLMKHLGLLTERKILQNPDGSNLIPNTIVHTFDPRNLTQEQLDALILLTNNKDPLQIENSEYRVEDESENMLLEQYLDDVTD